jgi:hypothetical protein
VLPSLVTFPVGRDCNSVGTITWGCE